MVDLHNNAHRLSLEWSRIEPRPGVWDDAALQRYREMLTGLRQRGIEPMVTLHHFTNPLWLAEQGGWENEAVIAYFVRYARKVVTTLGDLTHLWCTINEPSVMIAQAYGLGRWPPGKKDVSAGLRAALNLIRAHAAAYHAIHEIRPDARVGLAHHIIVWQPWRAWWPGDLAATNLVRHMFQDLLLGAIVRGTLRIPGRRSVRLPEAASSLDWLGVNYYQRYRIRSRLLHPGVDTAVVDHLTKPGVPKGPGEWGEIHPRGLFDTLRLLWRRYRIPLAVTENGIPDASDEHRPGFIVTHLHQLWHALRQGIPVHGYYFWSVVDNFEWTEGYNPHFKFGLFGVNFDTQERHIRPSGRLYAAIARSGGLVRATIEEHTPELAFPLFGRSGA